MCLLVFVTFKDTPSMQECLRHVSVDDRSYHSHPDRFSDCSPPNVDFWARCCSPRSLRVPLPLSLRPLGICVRWVWLTLICLFRLHYSDNNLDMLICIYYHTYVFRATNWP
ncbi:hypothetical protein NP493_490g02002 [Ridgeia piscesae]|uniref:Uncharacterized protein n=1 Tax=Ridgeia piscesae TaxID=27915 RepID=A0AAD9NU38_RIDPI|nr:hypothetical protein NP493_490g02002 [Ridgeia piscesae]